MAAERRQTADDMLRRVQGEYLEMPGLRLTAPQARRLWNLDQQSCESLLGALVDDHFLYRTRDGAFMRSDHADSVIPATPATPAKAALRPVSKNAVA